jgi:hypothetical protein
MTSSGETLLFTPADVTREELIGGGEFGAVYRSVAMPTTKPRANCTIMQH